jgi:hypothetical protein
VTRRQEFRREGRGGNFSFDGSGEGFCKSNDILANAESDGKLEC